MPISQFIDDLQSITFSDYNPGSSTVAVGWSKEDIDWFKNDIKNRIAGLHFLEEWEKAEKADLYRFEGGTNPQKRTSRIIDGKYRDKFGGECVIADANLKLGTIYTNKYFLSQIDARKYQVRFIYKQLHRTDSESDRQYYEVLIKDIEDKIWTMEHQPELPLSGGVGYLTSTGVGTVTGRLTLNNGDTNWIGLPSNAIRWR